MKKIKLFGNIVDEYKGEWMLDVSTPSEALRAINANRPGFITECDAGNYVVIMIDESNPDSSKQVTDENSKDRWGDETLYVVPKMSGDISAALVAGVIGVAAASTTALVVAVIVNIAIAVAIAAIAQLIAGSPDGFGASDSETPENKPSYLFNGVVNTTKQGHRIPILYGGPLLIGSMILSSRVNTKDIEA